MTEKLIRVAVAGAMGRMGSEVVKMVLNDKELTLVAGIDQTDAKSTIRGTDVPLFNSLERAIEQTKPDVLVDFTTPHSVKANIDTAIQFGVRPVVGTTGLTPEQIADVDKQCEESGIGCIIAPNFAIGAVLMMKFAQQAAKFMPHVEIIELHHDQKLDAPSGTAVKTAEMISAARNELKQGHPNEKETIEGARGAYYDGFRIHSVRIPGLVAHQEVIFGALGQTLTIRHDSISRESFMPGVAMAVKKVVKLNRLVYGLENIIEF